MDTDVNCFEYEYEIELDMDTNRKFREATQTWPGRQTKLVSSLDLSDLN